jgi:CDP-diacylglycerol---glycerol-3-phosphate 3-phosphatidyltransferase
VPNRNLFRQIPNILTLLRLLLIPVFVVLLLDPDRNQVNWAIAVFCVASFTDYLDGVIARRFKLITNFGKLLDPVADKVLVMAGLVMLTGLKGDETGEAWVQPWMVVMVLAREVWVTGLRAVAAAEGLVVPADGYGKWKSAMQVVAIVLLLLHGRCLLEINDRWITGRYLGEILLLSSLVLSYWGAAGYSWQILSKQFKQVAIDDPLSESK